jgi:hypothetical protein
MANAKTTTVVKYDATDIGRIYLRDVGGRNQMGNGNGIFAYGQDQYISYGSDTTLLNTSAVILSADRGVIKTYNKTTGPLGTGAFTVTQV